MSTTTATANSPTHDVARITRSRFADILKAGKSPAFAEAWAVYDILVAEGVEPAFALAQFRVESQYGTAGHAKASGSWGNMLFDKNLCLHADGTYAPGNGYTYATYANYADAIRDYCNYIHWYRDRYNLTTIYQATARWLGKTPGVAGHVSYVNIIVNDIIEYQYPAGTFYETGDKMINTDKYIDRATGRLNAKLFVAKGTTLYRGTDGIVLKQLTPAAGVAGLDLWFLGPVNDSWAWGVVILGLSDGSRIGAYIRTPDQTKVRYI